MKYRHSFHAGNFADTVKHLTLLEILKALRSKPAPFFYLDTHAGRGRYKLGPADTAPSSMPGRDPAATGRPGASQTSEFSSGFGRLRGQESLPAPLAEYVALIEHIGGAAAADAAPGAGVGIGSTAVGSFVHPLNQGVEPLQYYPGSPLIAAHLLRPEDRAVLFELGITEAEKLRITLRGFPNTTVQNADGYTALRSQLPPRERRGLVLIDPAYELQQAEFPRVLHALREGLRRWATGIFAVWYPIKQRDAVQRFHEQLKQTGVRKVLCAELCLYPDDSRVSLNGCGMIIINPPWRLEQVLQATLPLLHARLGGHAGTAARCFWLVPE